MVVVKTREFGSTGKQVSDVGLGGAQLIYDSNLEKQQIVDLIQYAYGVGINYFDTAPWYKSEELFGKVLEKFDRSSYFLATKVGRYQNSDISKINDLSASKTESSVLNSVRLLRTDCLDLVQVHDFDYAESGVEKLLSETLPMLDKLRQRGLLKYIGLTSYDLPKLQLVIEKSPVKIDSVLCHSRLTILGREMADYMPFFKSKGVAVVNAAPLAMGLLSSLPIPEWMNISSLTRDASRSAVKACKDSNFIIERLANGFCYKEGVRAGVDVLLTGASSRQLLDLNLKSYYEGLSEPELTMCQQLAGIFDTLPTDARDINSRACAAFLAAVAEIKRKS